MTSYIAEGAHISALKFSNLYYYISSSLELSSSANGVLIAVSILLCMVIPYLIGSINPAIIFSRLFYNDDVRSHGSGNAGTTNVLRTYGKKIAILTFVCDFLKAAVSVGIGTLIFYKNIGGAIAGLFVVIGHLFPLYYKFKGGKGVACSVAVVLLLEPFTFVCLFLIYAIIIIGTKYVSLASCMCIALYPIIVSAFENIYVNVFKHDLGAIPGTAVVIAVLVIYMHRENLKRLFNGTESKLSFGKKKAEEADAKNKKKGKKSKNKSGDADEKKYSDSDFVMCECGRVIPVTRKKCLYCGRENMSYTNSSKKGKEGN